MNVSAISQSTSADYVAPDADAPPAHKLERAGPSRAVVRRVLAVALIGVLALTLPAAVQGFYVQGTSMMSTLHPGQFVLVNKAATLFSSPSRGDVVVFDSPSSPGHDFVKRVIGLPGDRVFIDAGTVFVNLQPLDEPYVRLAGSYTYPANRRPLIVPDNSYFVLGDNRPTSVDSHLGWVVPAHNLIGKAFPLPWLPPMATTVARDPGDLIPEPVHQVQQVTLPVTDNFRPAAAPSPEGQRASTPHPEAVVEPASADPGLVLPSSWTRARVGNELPSRFVALGAPIADVPRDVTVSATFRKVGGAPGGGYGFILRNQSPGPLDGHNQTGNYYVLEAGDSGEFSVWRREGERWIELVSWTQSDAVRPGGADNTLTASAVGGHLTLSVNDLAVADLKDAALTDGGVGVFVGGDANDVAFERFTVAAARRESTTASLDQPELATTPVAASSAVPAAATPEARPAVETQGREPVESPLVERGISLPPALVGGHVRIEHAGRFLALGISAVDVPHDVSLSASFRKVGGPPGGGYGLILRDQSPAPMDGQNQLGNFYVLGAGDSGDFGVWRRDGERWIDLVPWTHSDVVRTGGGTNELTARAVGDHLTLTINGVQVGGVNDATLTEGGVGVFIGGDGNDVAIDALRGLITHATPQPS